MEEIADDMPDLAVGQPRSNSRPGKNTAMRESDTEEELEDLLETMLEDEEELEGPKKTNGQETEGTWSYFCCVLFPIDCLIASAICDANLMLMAVMILLLYAAPRVFKVAVGGETGDGHPLSTLPRSTDGTIDVDRLDIEQRKLYNAYVTCRLMWMKSRWTSENDQTEFFCATVMSCLCYQRSRWIGTNAFGDPP